ncbi:olfactory receptor 6N2-like [Pholidichthys leucotaenia]
MGLKLNETYFTLDGYVQLHKYRYLYFVIMFAVYILILCCNLTIVFLIVFKKSLHEPMYIFIAALLMNSVMFSTVVYPKLFIDFLSERQVMSYEACLFQSFMFYSLGGSEFLLLSAMAYDRYVSICKPLQYPTIMRNTTISIFLVLAWILPSSQVAVMTVLFANDAICSFKVKGIFCNNAILELLCVRKIAHIIHEIVILFIVALFPFFFILFTYTRILIISFQRNRAFRTKAAQTCLPHLLVLVTFSCSGTYDVLISNIDSDFSKTEYLVMTLQMLIYTPLFNPIIYGLKIKKISNYIKKIVLQNYN